MCYASAGVRTMRPHPTSSSPSLLARPIKRVASTCPNSAAHASMHSSCRARTSWDAADAAQAWAQIDRLLVDEAPAVPLYTLRQADFVSKRVGNYVFNPEFGVLLDQLWVR